MHSTVKQILWVLLALCLMLPSCRMETIPNEAQGLGNTGDSTAMGRYMEVPLAFPAQLTSPWIFNDVGDGAYYMLGTFLGSSDLQMWRSLNAGESWEQLSPGWLTDYNQDGGNLSSIRGAFTGDGVVYLYYEQNYWDENGSIVSEQHLIRAEEDLIQELPLPDGWQIDAVSLSPGGGLLLTTPDGILSCNENLEVLQTFPRGMFFTTADTLAVRNGNGDLSLFDLESGEPVGEIPCVQPVRQLSYQPEKEAYLYCNDSGLYRASPDALITEQLVDGRLSSLGAAHCTVFHLSSDGDAFFILLRNDDTFQFIKYVFDELTPTSPGSVLSVYSLQDSPTVRTAGNLYSQRNPDILVDFQVLLEESSAMTVSDALLSLATQLLANTGPDILVLDSLPYSSYMQKGVLLDLQGLQAVQNECLFPNLIDAYREGDGGLYAVPSKFELPLILAEGLEPAGSVKHMVDWLTQQEYPLAARLEGDVLDTFYPLCSWRWFLEDGTVNTVALSEDLEAMKVFGELQRALEKPEYLPGYDDSLNQCFWWATDQIALVLLAAKDSDSLGALHAALLAREGSAAHLVTEASDALFLPSGLLGVNAASSHLEAAQNFVQFVLEEEVQALPLYDGFPVNQAVFESFLGQREFGESTYRLSNINHRTGEEILFHDVWPDEAACSSILQAVSSLSIPAQGDVLIQQMVLEGARDYFRDNETLEHTVNALERKMQRYLDEQQ